MNWRFTTDVLTTLAAGFRFSAPNNVDPFRSPGKTIPDAVGPRTALRALAAILRRSSLGAATVSALDEPESKRLLLDLCAFRVAGGRHYRLPRNDAAFWRSVESVRTDLLVERGVSRAGGYDLDLYRIPGATGPIEFEAHPMNILNSFLIEEYRFARSGIVIEAGPRDIVVDAGGCWGDTALYFADRAPSGKVFVFEFEEENLEVLRRNLARNPRLAGRIEIIERALWSTSGEKLTFADAGPGTKVRQQQESAGGGEIESLSMDDWVGEAGIPRVDFIKMDIEGAEVPALMGSQRTIHAFMPTLAISIYHSIGDLLTIPRLLRQFDAAYEIHLAHATIHAEETIAFATARR